MQLPTFQASQAPPEWDLLLSAAQKNRPDKIREFLEHGVDPSHSNVVGQSALHIAVLWGNVEACRVLLEAGANPLAQNTLTGATPLHMAAQTNKANENDREAIIDLLLAEGADTSQTDFFNKIPLDFYLEGRESNDENGIGGDTLIDKLQPKPPDLFSAIEEFNVEQVEQHLSQMSSEPPTNELSFKGYTIVTRNVEELLNAIDNDQQDAAVKLVKILNLLLEAGFNANAAAKLGSDEIEVNDPPLLQVSKAIREKSPATNMSSLKQGEFEPSWSYKLLQEAAVALFVIGDAAVTPETVQLLHTAARRNQVVAMQFFIEKLSVDCNAAGRQGMTALQFAARSGQLQAIEYLLQQPGIAILHPDDRGQTALSAAKVNGKDQVVKILEDYIEKHLDSS